ncbi:UbiA family prenyltransferase [Pelagibacteraceae bacterium]|nr:UbiA family prenyltransferase [Pelagibacteraceae bacterium]
MITNSLSLIRVKDWLKNILLFLPLVFSGKLIQYNLYTELFLSFFLFSLASSFIYILNDIKDLEDDKKHLIKKIKKPLASNKLTLSYAYKLMFFLIFLITGYILVNNSLFYHIIIYILINICYSIYLKKIPFLEIILISFGYLIRLDAGSQIINVETSLLLSSAVFSLAFFVISIKRYVEITNQYTKRTKLKFYSPNILYILIFLSALLFIFLSLVFFIISKSILIVSTPILIFILYRYFKVADGSNLGEFPIEVIIKDKLLFVSGLVLFLFTIFIYIISI